MIGGAAIIIYHVDGRAVLGVLPVVLVIRRLFISREAENHEPPYSHR